MSKWHNIRDNKPEVPGNIFCVESIGQNRLFPYTSKGEYREINGINYIYTVLKSIYMQNSNELNCSVPFFVYY